MFFKCRVCTEKDLRIEELKAQAAFLKSLIPQTTPDILPLNLEAQKILEGSLSHVVDLETLPSSDKLKELQRIQTEAAKILSGDIIENE